MSTKPNTYAYQHLELPTKSPLELTEVYTLLVDGVSLSAEAFQLKRDEEIRRNQEVWGHDDGPEWLDPAITHIQGGTVQFDTPEQESNFPRYVRKVGAFLSAKGISLASARAAVQRAAEVRRDGMARYQRFLSLLRMMAVEGQILLRARTFGTGPDYREEMLASYFEDPIEFIVEENALRPAHQDDKDRRSYYWTVLIKRSDALKLVGGFRGIGNPQGGAADDLSLTEIAWAWSKVARERPDKLLNALVRALCEGEFGDEKTSVSSRDGEELIWSKQAIILKPAVG